MSVPRRSKWRSGAGEQAESHRRRVACSAARPVQPEHLHRLADDVELGLDRRRAVEHLRRAVERLGDGLDDVLLDVVARRAAAELVVVTVIR